MGKYVKAKYHRTQDQDLKSDLPTKARMTVRRGAAGKVRVALYSIILSKSMIKLKIWCWLYLNNIVMETV